MKNKKLVIYLGLILTITLFTTGCGKSSKLETEKTTAVKMKGGEITADQFYKELKKDSIEKLITMVDHKLFDKKYPSDDAEEKSVNQQIEQLKSYYTDNEDGYLAAIKSYFGVENEEELKELLALEYKRNLAVNDYIKSNLTDAEIQKYYDENIYADIKASHILISVKTTEKMSDAEKDKAKEKALTKAKKVISLLNEGKDFSKLAKKYSDDDQTASKGGDLGYFNSEDMDGSFWNAALSLKKKEYTKEPVESSYGYHIILKTGEKEKESLDSLKETIKETLTKDKLSNSKTLYYETLKDIRSEKKITFGDSDLEKQYNKYMDTLIKNANNSTDNNTQK